MSDKILVDRKLLQDLVDICVGGMDFGSGFLDREQSDSLVAAAQLLDIDPLTVVQSTDLCSYYAQLNNLPFAHNWGEWQDSKYRNNNKYRTCSRCTAVEQEAR